MMSLVDVPALLEECPSDDELGLRRLFRDGELFFNDGELDLWRPFCGSKYHSMFIGYLFRVLMLRRALQYLGS